MGSDMTWLALFAFTSFKRKHYGNVMCETPLHPASLTKGTWSGPIYAPPLTTPNIQLLYFTHPAPHAFNLINHPSFNFSLCNFMC